MNILDVELTSNEKILLKRLLEEVEDILLKREREHASTTNRAHFRLTTPEFYDFKNIRKKLERK